MGHGDRKLIVLVGSAQASMKDDVQQLAVDSAFALPLITATSAKEAADVLFRLLLDVARRHQPEIEPVLRGVGNISDFTPELMARTLQAQGIWFQLLSIAEQNAAMRRRRHIERTRGRENLRGTFANVLAEAARSGIGAEEIQKLLAGLRIRPVITAHPTESKRVTVLEKYRRIYLLLQRIELILPPQIVVREIAIRTRLECCADHPREGISSMMKSVLALAALAAIGLSGVAFAEEATRGTRRTP
jgi:phosphoenolpyruvate carboxylase